MHLSQKANGTEEAWELAWGAEGGEELIQKCADGTVCLGMHVLYGLHMWKICGQSRGMCCEVKCLLEIAPTDASICKHR
jgi:hypothetical protein